MSKFNEIYTKLNKSILVEKPGNSIHTPKFDRCVAQVEAQSEGANAYAVCTAMMGDDAFKSMDDETFEEKMKFYMQKLGLQGAGPVPNSLLARQDLEGVKAIEDLWMWRQGDIAGGQEVSEKSFKKVGDIQNFAVWYYDASGARKCAVFGNYTDANAYAMIVETMGYKDVSINKGTVESTQKDLIEAAADAKEADETEKNSLINRIKGIQLKRQNSTINARGAESKKSFREKWGEISRS
jgi:hypothetical protein